MTTLGPDVDRALEPVRAALLAAARRAAQGAVTEAAEAAEATVARARHEATALLADAHGQGAAEAQAAIVADRIQAGRAARGAVLAARREGYEALRTQGRAAAVRALGDDPRVAARLAAAVRRDLGAGARVQRTPDGGVVGELPGRRLDYSVTGFADRAVDEVAAGLEEP